MDNKQQRRDFLKKLALMPVLSVSGWSYMKDVNIADEPIEHPFTSSVKTSLNAYSFNEPFTKGAISPFEMMDFCAKTGFDAIDLTAYYIQGYPDIPGDDYIFQLKRKAFLLGLEISGTGVRNNFTQPDEGSRKKDIQLVKNWIDVATKIGAPVIRIFSGPGIPEGYHRKEVTAWVVEAFQECADYGESKGVMVGLQNHNDFLKTADQVIQIMNLVESDWFGLILDIGSFRAGDPYTEIEKAAPYAISWQIKEKVYVNEKEEEAQLNRIVNIVRKANYRGYLPLETLGPGDPYKKLPVFLNQLKRVLHS